MFTANYSDSQKPQFRILSDGQCREILLAAMEVLCDIGVRVNNSDARALLAAAGATVNGMVVRIPSHLVENAIASAPRSFKLWGRDPGKAITVTMDKVNWGPGITNTYFIDPESGEKRKSRRGDPALTARVCEALENIDYVIGLALIDDVTSSLAPVYEFAELVANTTKPILAWAFNTGNLEAIYKIALTVAGSEESLLRRPFFGVFSTFQSPLMNTDEDLANIQWAAEKELPVVYMGGGTASLSAPSTPAATVVVSLATALSGLTIHQLKKRGAPFVLGGVPLPADLRTSRVAYGGPEASLYAAMFGDVCRYIDVPFMGTAGAADSKILDSQAAIESTLQVVISALNGASMVHDIGFLDCAEIGSLPLLVMTDEIIGMVRRLMRGVEVNANTIMMDLIAEAGPGGHFMAEPRSAKIARHEIWMPKLLDRNSYTVWEQRGSLSMERRAEERVRKILAAEVPSPLPEEIRNTMEEILAEAENSAGQRRSQE